jgi:SAM-dependent methyltransferase
MGYVSLEFQTGNLSAALGDFTRATPMAPSPIAYFWLGRTFEGRQDLRSALPAYGAAVRMAPEFAMARDRTNFLRGKIQNGNSAVAFDCSGEITIMALPQAAATPVAPDERLVDPECCQACGGPLRVRFAAVRDAQTRAVFSILECARCGLGHTAPRPKDLAKYYRGYHGGRHGMTASYCARRRLRILRQVAAGAPGHLLDIGCGDGTFLLAAHAAGWSVVGTEMNTGPARQAGLEVYPNISDMHSRAPFDAITLWHTFEHLTGLRATLEDIRRLLSANGVLIIAVPNAGGLQAGIFGSQWFHLDVPRHLYHFTRSSLVNLLQSEGFLPSREWHQEFEYDLLGWSQSALNLLAPGRPNLFFDLLRGFQPPIGKLASAAAWLSGALLMALTILLVPVGTLIRRGGTLIISARPHGQSVE